ncbi:hypothetical protein MFLAVUS_002508 [Mucor flavus]|uniref:Vacuolar protein sorting-associated protein 27 n=1 Tax=Mucor flavus TaxID=439312 RepID=A0ABP9YQG3_9FUNG
MGTFWWGQSALDELIEKATSELLPAGQVDLALHLEISDQIRSKKVTPKDAMKSLKQRLGHKNPNVVLATLSLVDTCVKNSGSSFVKEVATRDFMEEITHLIKVPTGCNQDVKQKVLYLIQVWGIASKGNSSLSYISGTYSLLRAEGYTFPPITERIDSILLETAVAPEWTDSDCCERCRTPFTLTNRKHHCRQCGATFCQQCSSKNIPLPHLGINDTVRVCDGCYIKVKLSKVADKDAMPNLLGTSASISSSLTPAYTPSIKTKTAETVTTATATMTTTPPPPDDQFEDDLKKAIEISLKESEQQKKIVSYSVKKDPVIVKKTKEEQEEEENLAAAIAASLKDMDIGSTVQSRTFNSNELSSIDMENIQLFSTLIQRVRSMGGDISGDSQINKLYTQIGALQPKLVKTLNNTSQKHDNFVQLHEKLNKAVKAYDNLLEQRLSNATHRTSVSYTPYYGTYNPPSTNPPYNQAPSYTLPAAVSTQQPDVLYQPNYSQYPTASATPHPYNAIPSTPQQYNAVTSTPVQQHYTADRAAQLPYTSTPIQPYTQPYTTSTQSYTQPCTASTPIAPTQQFPVTPITPISSTTLQPSQPQYTSYQQQFPSVPTTAPEYYNSQPNYYNNQQQQKQPVEEAPLIEL